MVNVNTQERDSNIKYSDTALGHDERKKHKRAGGARPGRARGTSGNLREIRFRFGQRVMQLRLARGLSQAEVGKYFGLTKQAWGEVERGGISVTLDRLQEVATYFKVPLAYLIAEDVPDNIPQLDLLEKLQIIWPNIPEERRQYLYDIAVLFEQQTVVKQPPPTVE